MAQHGSMVLAFVVTIILSLFSFSSCNINEHLLDQNIQEETGYDFQAYPLYTSSNVAIDGGSQVDNSTNINKPASFHGLRGFSKLGSAARAIKVESYGAKGDGAHDDTQAFEDAWKQACSSTQAVTFLVSKGKQYLLKPITFSGPCKSQITVQIFGILEASKSRSDYSKAGRYWIMFQGIKNLIVEGGGIVNGNGNIWWQNSCKINKALPCKDAPTAITFYKCQNLVVQNLNIRDAQQMHVSFENCVNVQASHLVVKAPESSPNTDGIHVTNTQNIQISGCTIGTGDDCISIESGSQKVKVSDITCGPGHGISIGSLGDGNSEAYVSDVTVNGATLSGTTNGVRIKTWQGGSGSASNIKFENVQMSNVKNPIIIDQNYCDQSSPCTNKHSAVQVKNVLYQSIKGTSDTDVAINLDCSKSFPCQGIVLQNVDLVQVGGGAAKASCNNINLSNTGAVSPRCP